MFWSTQIGAEAKASQKVDTLESSFKVLSEKVDKVVKIETEILQMRRDIQILVNSQEEYNSLSKQILLLERRETATEHKVEKLTDYAISLSDKVVQVEKNQAVDTEILSMLNDTLSKLDETMDANLKHINTSIGEVKGQVASMDGRLKGVEKKLGGD
jgi:chromosome segregation ATPase